MAEKDIGSLVVMDHGDLVGMLTFREVIQTVASKMVARSAQTLVRTAMDDAPLTCTMETELDEVRRMMLDRHARYMPVMESRMLMGVISFYDVAKRRGGQPELREQDAQGLHPRLAGRRRRARVQARRLSAAPALMAA
jgi:CBS domain-containing protein